MCVCAYISIWSLHAGKMNFKHPQQPTNLMWVEFCLADFSKLTPGLIPLGNCLVQRHSETSLMVSRKPQLNRSFRSLVAKKRDTGPQDVLFNAHTAEETSASSIFQKLQTAVTKRLFYSLLSLLETVHSSADATTIFSCIWMALQPLGKPANVLGVAR